MPLPSAYAPASNRFRSRGLALSAAAGAGCALASVAQAQIVYKAGQNLVLSKTAKLLDFDSDGTTDLSGTAGGKGGPSFSSTGFTGRVVVLAASGSGSTTVAKLDAGTSISGSNLFSGAGVATGFSGTGTTWVNGDTDYVGFSFLTGGSTYYGWMKVGNITPGLSSTGTILSWAYNSTAGASILAGQTVSAVPEPATTALGAGAIVLGVALRLKRRRRSRGPAVTAGRTHAPATEA